MGSLKAKSAEFISSPGIFMIQKYALTTTNICRSSGDYDSDEARRGISVGLSKARNTGKFLVI